MTTRSAAALASGTLNAAKLFVGALAFTSAYAGLSAYHTAGSAPRPVRTVELSAREMPLVTPARTAAEPAPGTIAVTAAAHDGPGCRTTLRARGVIVSPEPGGSVLYGWRLARWSPSAREWRTYLVSYDGFAGARHVAAWEADVTANPGSYRFELSGEGLRTVTSARVTVSC
ncbi:hypothetical protein [Nonomuraea pusilla]|uniref:Uncharacterized protein n=1 Tax=Nonomuraea pusilla TaxID=46177 RepID=A0A1H8I728_9ACTN|nr:hypothetical protein [Nonomuraea pusilla]SEN63688.1 hypothetical protein SAMN05660976_07971 [Nonomuraea pusilla]